MAACTNLLKPVRFRCRTYIRDTVNDRSDTMASAKAEGRRRYAMLDREVSFQVTDTSRLHSYRGELIAWIVGCEPE